jgi:hypothetical protein
MLLGQVFERFVEESPVSVMVRGLLETILSAEKLDELFEKSTKTQYTRELLFSRVVEMMNTVTCGIRPSIHAAYQAKASQMNVSVTSVYNKLNAMEPNVSAELVRNTGASMEAIIRHLNGSLPDWLPGYRLQILDGNAIAASEHRLKPLRDCNSAPLPGQSLVVLVIFILLKVWESAKLIQSDRIHYVFCLPVPIVTFCLLILLVPSLRLGTHFWRQSLPSNR